MALGFGGDWDESLEDDDICLGISSAMRESFEDDWFFDSKVEQISNNKEESMTKMNEELKPCPECQQKDKEITKLKEDLKIQKNLTRQACFESNRAYDEVEKWKKMFYDLWDKQARVDTNPKVIIIGKDTDDIKENESM